jgi:hypothetical protein
MSAYRLSEEQNKEFHKLVSELKVETGADVDMRDTYCL